MNKYQEEYRKTGRSKFVPCSNYPSKEYRELLKFNICILKDAEDPCNPHLLAAKLISQKIDEYKERIEDLDTYWYAAMDLYVVDPKTAENIHSKDVIENIKNELALAQNNKSTLTHKVYYDFVNNYGLKTILTT